MVQQVDSNYGSNGDQIGFWVQSTKTQVFRWTEVMPLQQLSEVVGNFQTVVEGTSTTWYAAGHKLVWLWIWINHLAYLLKWKCRINSCSWLC